MNLLSIALANIRKKKGATVSLGILIALTALLLNTGFMLALETNRFFDFKMESLQSPHNVTLISGNLYMPEFLEFFEKDTRVSSVELEEVVTMDVATTKFANGYTELAAIFLNADSSRQFLPFTLTQKLDVPDSDAIYLPLGFAAGSPGLGEPFTVTYKNKVFTFRVAGFFETTVMGTSNAGNIKYFLGNGAFSRLHEEIGGSKMISMSLHDPNQSEALQADFKAETEALLFDDPLLPYVFTYRVICEMGTMVPNLYASAMIGFAAMILLIVSVVTRFRIDANIEDNMHNIGALGALGYTPGQIIRSVLLEFGLLSFVGAILGTLLSLACMPLMGTLLTQAGGLVWESHAQFPSVILCLLFILASVLIVCAISTLKIRRLPPILALNQERTAHTFQKNWFPLSKGGLFMGQLIGKQIIAEWKQNLTLLAVFCGISFTVIFTSVIYTNLVVNQDAFMRMLGVEIADVRVDTMPHVDADRLAQTLLTRAGVRNITMADMPLLSVGSYDVLGTISDDFSKMETINVYQGVLPQYENEIVITSMLADLVHKQIGDLLEVKYRGVSGSYLITGLTQSTNMEGKVCFMTRTGIQRLDPFYERNSININLEEGVDVSQFIEALKQEYSAPRSTASETTTGWETVDASARKIMTDLLTMYDVNSVQYALMVDGVSVVSGSSESYQIDRIQDFRARLEAQTYSISALVSQLFQLILIVSLLIVALVLFLFIRSAIQKQQRTLGIYKSIGYTSWQLTRLISESFLPAAFVGTVLGMGLGRLYSAPLLTKLCYNIGLSQMMLLFDQPMMFALCSGILLYSYGISLLAARRIRKLSVYGLLTE